MIPRRIGNSFAFALALLLIPAAARADVTVLAEVEPPAVAIGEPFRLEVRVRSTGLGGPGDLVVPQSKNLRQVGHATSETVSLVNGRMNRESVDTYTYVPLEPGRYTFQGLGVRQGSKFVAGNVVSVNVTAAAPPAPPAQAGPAPAAPEAPADALALPPPGEDVFVAAGVDRPRVRVGEPVVYTFRFYYRINPDQPTYDAPDFSGFQTYDLGQSKEPRQIQVRGQTYEYFDLRTLLYPLRSGELTIGSAGLAFRTSFFFTREYRRRSKPVTVQVDPLPESPPANFHGAVGDFSVRSSGAPARVALHEPLTLWLTVAGTGNFAAVAAPDAVSSGNWRIYPGRVSNDAAPAPGGVTGAKTFEVLLQPPAAGRVELPRFAFSYFDLSEGRYVSIVTGPAEVTVTGEAAAKAKAAPPPVALRPVRHELGAAPADPLRPWRLMLWLTPLPLVGLALLMAGGAVQRRMRTVTPADRAVAARRKWERALAAKNAAPADVLKSLDAWLGERYGLSATPTEAEIRSALGTGADALLQERRRLEAAVFGGAKVDVARVQRGLQAWTKTLAAVLLAALVLGGAAVAARESGEALFAKAQEAQMQGDFAEAVRLYRRAGELAGPRVNLLYNLSGAAWRAGEAGLARYAIETAYARAPRDGDVAANRNLIAGAIADAGGSAEPAAPAPVTLEEAGWLTVALYALFTALVLAGWFRRPFRWAAALAFILCLPVAGFAAYLYDAEQLRAPGVVWQAEPLRESADAAGAEVAPLPAGEIGHVTDREGDWVRIQTPSGLSGWIPEASWRPLALVKTPPRIPE